MEQIVLLISRYRYTALFPLAAFEGPIVALAVGFFVFLGYLQFFPSFVILILGDIIPDSAYYYLGRYGNRKKLIEKYRSRSPLLSQSLDHIEKLWVNHGSATMFLSKLAYGLSIPFLMSAGFINMPYRKFIVYVLPVTVFQYGVILALGYFLGNSYQLAERYIHDAVIALAGIAVLLLAVGFMLLSRYARAQVLGLEKNGE